MRVSGQDEFAVSEIVETKPTLASRGLGAVAALQAYFPGVLVSLIIAVAATFLSEHYGGPVMLFALLLGMAFYFLSQEGPCVAGIEFASKSILRVAVGLLGAQITISEIMKLGPTPVIMVIGAVTATILFGVVGARVAGLSRPFGILTSGAVAICGASAALAISSVLPKGENHERDTVFTVIGVTALSTIAMIVYPVIIAFFHLDHAAIGVFLGGTIHDVAQVVGAGFSVSEETGNVATFTKLLRVAMLLPVVVTLSFVFHAHNTTKAGRQLPGFLVVFAVLVVVKQPGNNSSAGARCAQNCIALVPGHGNRCARNENVAQGDGRGGWERDRLDRRRDGVSGDSRVGDCGVEVLSGGNGAAAAAQTKKRINDGQRKQRQAHVDDRHQGFAGLGLSALHPGHHGGGHGP